MRGLTFFTVCALLVVLPTPALAQAGACQLIENVYTERRMEGAFSVIFIQGPLLVRCSGGAEIRSEIGTLYEATREIHLSGSVSFQDPERRLTSHRATYASVTGRLYATGDVVFTDLTEGMTLRGPELEYYRATDGRPQSQAIATQRPHLTLQPRPRAGEARPADSEPVEIDADRMTMVGNEQYSAVGSVEIRRSDFQAFSREAHIDQVSQRMELRGEARIHGEQFDLVAEMIDVLLPEDRLEEVYAQRDAELVGEDLRVDAPSIRLFFADDLLQRMIARGSSAPATRAVATARAFRLEADSIEALVPGQRLERVVAIGSARGESLDTTNVPPGRLARAAPLGSLTAAQRDWILGDTVTGYFVAVDTTDVAADAQVNGGTAREEVALDRVVALGSAQSLYRIQSNRNGQPQPRLGLNYLAGEMIELSFRDGELNVADVRGLQRGLYLDPVEAAAEPESTPAAPDQGERPPSTETATGDR